MKTLIITLFAIFLFGGCNVDSELVSPQYSQENNDNLIGTFRTTEVIKLSPNESKVYYLDVIRTINISSNKLLNMSANAGQHNIDVIRINLQVVEWAEVTITNLETDTANVSVDIRSY